MVTIDKFAIFILTHGRPGKVITYNTLKRQGYTGDIYIIVDNEDKTVDWYRQRFGDQVIIFDKLGVAKRFDTGDNFNDRRTVVFARNACFEIARELGLDYFLQLDDDYKSFVWKFNSLLQYAEKPVKNLDALLSAVLGYYKTINALTIALAQNGDFLGGQYSGMATKLQVKRKCMNTFFCSTARPFDFVGRVNEDVNTYCVLGNRGDLMFTLPSAAIIQVTTQAGSGGMTDIYMNEGTYVKSFYSVMYAPSFVTIAPMGYRHRRLHHRVSWDHAVPRILDEKWRKSTLAQ